jgi:spermidine dehydrogenase
VTKPPDPDGARDRELGLFAPITRRDVLQGMGTAFAGALATPWIARAGKDEAAFPVLADDYPPARTGLRGSHPGSFEVAHARVLNGQRWTRPEVLDERYDLVVVGAGISGLAAAYFYRRAAGGDARILILDNHDDFGGHARRNEFQYAGRSHIGLGGSVFLEYSDYSDTTRGLLQELGVDIEAVVEQQDPDFIFGPLGLESGIYFDAAGYGRDVLVTGRLLPPGLVGPGGVPNLAPHVASLPLSAEARRGLHRLLTEPADHLPELPDDARPAALQRLSYQDFLVKRAGLSEEVAQLFHAFPKANWGLGADAVPTLDALLFGLPGLRGLGDWGRELEQQLGREAGIVGALLPDGNATIARLLVRALVPAVADGSTLEDVVAARFDYAQLDRPGSPVRLRLRSTAVHVDPLPGDAGSDVTYVRGGRAQRVRARNCVLACYNAMIPFLCPALPEAQQQALRYGQKTPLVSSNVLLREGALLKRAGAASFYSPGRLHTMAFAQGRTVGRYASGWNPAEPVVLHMIGALAPGTPGMSANQQFLEGRRRLLGMSFEDFEREIRSHLAGLFGAAGFDPASDILAITVNRWPHGYAYEANPLFDPDWPEGQAPNEIGRRRFGRIAIANSDAGYHAYVDGAIDQAQRAVEELVKAELV